MGGSLRWLVLGVLGFSVVVGGCRRTFRAETVQPNPLLQQGVVLRHSIPVVIVTGDKDLQVPVGQVTQQGMTWSENKPYPLKNIAQFTVVSRDRLRFHVHLEHKWEEYANPTNWDAYLIDDKGRTYHPEQVDSRKRSHTSKMWEYERRAVSRNQFGDITRVNPLSGHIQRTSLASFTLYQGNSDFVFYHRNIFTPSVKRLRLVIKHKATAFEWTWRFDEPGARVANQD